MNAQTQNIAILVVMATGPQGLSTMELLEFNDLKRKLFKDDIFVSFSDEVLNSKEFKRYDALMKKKMAHCEYCDKINRAKTFN